MRFRAIFRTVTASEDRGDAMLAPHLHVLCRHRPNAGLQVDLVPCGGTDLACASCRKHGEHERELRRLVTGRGPDLGVRHGRMVSALARPLWECGLQRPVAGVVVSPARRDAVVEDDTHALLHAGSR